MDTVNESEVFARLGLEGFTRLTAAFYRRVRIDPLLGPLYPQNDFAAAEQRLRDFLVQRFGGPDTYSQTRGHPRLRMRHAPFPIDLTARDRWMHLMDAALSEAKIDADIAGVLRPYFKTTATFMINKQ